MHYYPFFIRDHDADTKGLNLTQQGAYRKLLDHFFDTERPLSRNRLGLYKLIGATSRAERAAVDSVLMNYWTETDEGWVQKRAQKELRKMQARRKAAQANGKRGGRPSKAETQSVMEMARLEPVPGNPLGFGYGLAEWPEEKPTGFFSGNPAETQPESYLQSKPKNKNLRAHAHARGTGVDGSLGASENRLAGDGASAPAVLPAAPGAPTSGPASKEEVRRTPPPDVDVSGMCG